MSDFLRAVQVVLAHEGGFADDPDDPGGATNYGVSLEFAKRECGLELDLNHDGRCDADDIKILTREDAVEVYMRHWWQRYGYERIVDQQVATKVFDMAVNMGAKQAHRLLQRSLNELGEQLDEDGILGPATLAATNASDARILLAKLVAVQSGFYRTISRSRPQLAKFLPGWIKRAGWPIGGLA